MSEDDFSWAQVAVRTLIARCLKSLLVEWQAELRRWVR